MAKADLIKNYDWDIAISLCKQDADFAKKLVKAINPTLKVFFYEDRQEELISKSGPVAFAKTFKEQSRIVVILSRDEWSNSYYTEIERNAIIDRTAVKNEGYSFLMVIPMVQGEIPTWYPSTYIYASPFKFTIEELAHFIEFKVTEEGGILKSLTVEDRHQNLLDRIEIKKSIIKLQQDNTAILSARNEMKNIKNSFNQKSEFLRKSIVDKVSWNDFDEHTDSSYFGYGDFLLVCQFTLPDEICNRIVTTQDFWITFSLFKTFDSGQNSKTLESEKRAFYYTPELQGWALPNLYEQATHSELQVLFRNRDNSQYYDLINPLQTTSLVDKWFQRLLINATQVLERYI
nr:hypothetical protein [uncultured Draconibacterium sp.]